MTPPTRSGFVKSGAPSAASPAIGGRSQRRRRSGAEPHAGGLLPFWALGIPLGALLLALVGPLVFLVALAGWPGIVAAYADPAFLASLSLTLSGATVATAFAIFLTAPAAYGLVHASLPRSVAAVLEGALASPVAVPHVVVGLAILVTFSPLSPLARILGGFSVLETFGGMVAAFFVVSAPLALSTLKSAFAAEDPRLHLAARALGATPTRAFLRVTVPTHGRSFVEAFFVAWARSVSEFGSVAILTYFVFEPAWFGGASPASVFVFAQYQASGLYVAMRFAAALLFVSVLPLVVLAWYRRFHAERS